MVIVDPAREFTKDVKRLIIKVGTCVVTRGDGSLALGRLGALCKNVKDLISKGYEVIIVTSGAVAAGREISRSGQPPNNRIGDLQRTEEESNTKYLASLGQTGLFALYKAKFKKLGVTISQFLVTNNDFRNLDCKRQLCETVNTSLQKGNVPIFNENDAISTRKAAYKDSSGIFRDNDSLAALLASELKADLLVLLSDVDGLYSGPPSDPKSKLIHTYLKEKHHGQITFGDKSGVGRGGMTAKVEAAVNAASSGTPVVITSGFATDSIVKVLEGENVGTLFHRDLSGLTFVERSSARDVAVSARDCSRRLKSLSSEEREKILLDIADALEANEEGLEMNWLVKILYDNKYLVNEFENFLGLI